MGGPAPLRKQEVDVREESRVAVDALTERVAERGDRSGKRPRIPPFGHGVASGWLAVEGLGQWAVAGPAAGTFTACGVGVAVSGLPAALAALYRLPARAPAHKHL